MKKISISFILLIFIIQSCQKVPVSNRRQLHLLPESTMLSMSLDNYSTFIKEHQVVNHSSNADMVQRAGEKIAIATESLLRELGYQDRIPEFQWEFNLVDDTAQNAWCMPGGKVVVYTGLLPVTQNETALAVVMGHEIAHAVARHGNERMSQSLALYAGGMALNVALSQKPEQTRNLFLAAYGLGASVGVMLPFSRKHESEADRIGLIFMAKAGYNPREAINFWQRMEAMSKNNPPEFLSTHPSHQTRIQDIKNKYLPEALNYYKGN